MNKYISAYAGGGSPQFIEGPVFKMLIPLAKGVSGGAPEGVDEGVMDTVRDTVNDTVIAGFSAGVKARAIEIIRLLYQQPMLKVADLTVELGVAGRTVKEDLKRLADQNLIVYQGSKKTGGYILSQELHDKQA